MQQPTKVMHQIRDYSNYKKMDSFWYSKIVWEKKKSSKPDDTETEKMLAVDTWISANFIFITPMH